MRTTIIKKLPTPQDLRLKWETKFITKLSQKAYWANDD